MSNPSEDELWDMSDEDLEAAFKEANADMNSPDIGLEQDAEPAQEAVTGESSDEEVDVEGLEDDSQTDDEDVSEIADNENSNGSDNPDSLEESDHDASPEAEADDVDADNTAESDDDNPDGDVEPGAEESPEDAEKPDAEEQPPRSYSFRANGQDYDFTSEEIVEQFPKMFGKAMDYTKKLQAIKPWRKTIDAMEDAKLSHEDVGLMIDVMKGDKDAITEMLKRTGTDTLELDTEVDSGYVAKDYGRDENALAVSDVVNEISRDAEYATTHNILSSQWDDSSWETMSQKPDMIRLLHEDVKSGMYSTLQPIAEKLKLYGDGSKTDLDYYAEAAQQHHNKTAQQNALKANRLAAQQKAEAEAAQKTSDENAERVATAKRQAAKRASEKKASAKRKAAAPSKTVSTSSVAGMLEDTDAGFDEWYKNLQESM